MIWYVSFVPKMHWEYQNISFALAIVQILKSWVEQRGYLIALQFGDMKFVLVDDKFDFVWCVKYLFVWK